MYASLSRQVLILIMNQTQQVPQQHRDGDLANGRYVDASLLLDRRAIEVLLAGKVDADCTVPDQLRVDFVGLAGDTADDDVAQWQALLERPV